jgi:hypothetical protein
MVSRSVLSVRILINRSDRFGTINMVDHIKGSSLGLAKNSSNILSDDAKTY